MAQNLLPEPVLPTEEEEKKSDDVMSKATGMLKSIGLGGLFGGSTAAAADGDKNKKGKDEAGSKK